MTAPLDLTKPIMLPHDKKPWRVVYCDGASVLVDGGSLNARIHHTRQYIDEYAKNIPPEPPKPVGPDEVTVSVWPDGAMSLMHGHPPAVQVRYIRADLAEDPPGSWSATDPIRSRLPRKVRPLTDEECDDLLTKFERGGLGYFKVRPWYEKIMAARGIEVGE